MDKVTYRQYQKIIRRKAWDRFKREHPIFDLVVPLVIAFAVGLAESIRITGRVEPVITAFVTAVGTAIIYSILYIWYFSREHVAVYNGDQQQLAEQFNTIHPKVNLELSPYHPEAGDNGVRWAGIYIQNRSGIQAIQQCKVQLISFYPKVRGVDNLPSDLMWSDNNRPDPNGFLKIDRDGTAILDIVVSYENYSGGTVTLRRGGGIVIFPPGVFAITFKINGTINSNDFDPQIYSANIVLEQGKDIRIENISKRSES